MPCEAQCVKATLGRCTLLKTHLLARLSCLFLGGFEPTNSTINTAKRLKQIYAFIRNGQVGLLGSIQVWVVLVLNVGSYLAPARDTLEVPLRRSFSDLDNPTRLVRWFRSTNFCHAPAGMGSEQPRTTQ